MRVFLGLFLLFFIGGCLEPEQSKKPLIGDFIKSEMVRLMKEKPLVTKVSKVNGVTDTLHSDAINWEKELHVFLNNDIRETQLIEYTVSVDTEFVGSRRYRKVRYTAKEPEQQIRFLIVAVDLDKPEEKSVEILVEKKHELFSYYKRLVYSTNYGFTIQGSQSIEFIDKIDYSIDVQIDKYTFHF